MEDNKKVLVNEIVKLEYKMFDKVKGIDGRASCQDNFNTFFVMRYSQFIVLSLETLENYKRDLIEGESNGRNLITEKYAHMMEYTDREYYEKILKNNLEKNSERKLNIISKIMELLEIEYEKFEKKYPAISSLTRPKNKNKVANIDVYMEGELKTYSEKTLESYFGDVMIYLIEGKSIIEEIQRETMKFYGYDTLDMAEIEINKINKN